MQGRYNRDIHHRRSVRLQNYDYAQSGAYFVTICSWQRENLFGDIVDGEMALNEYGGIVEKCWHALTDHYRHLESDEFVIMPNHFHGIIMINNCRGEVASPGDQGRGDPAPT